MNGSSHHSFGRRSFWTLVAALVLGGLAGCAFGEMPLDDGWGDAGAPYDAEEGDTGRDPTFLDVDLDLNGDDASDVGDDADVCVGPSCVDPCLGGDCDADLPPDCSAEECVVGATECDGPERLRSCVADANGCGVWATPSACSDGGRCQDGACQVCIDGDDDGFGVGCVLGDDCDDADVDRSPALPERCDGKDNDCNGVRDDGFDVGAICEVGLGQCRRQGHKVCNQDGTGTTCSAIAGQPSPEVCDGLDNNCDGQTDEGGACDSTCLDDAQEPNNSSTTGTMLPVGQSLQAKMCGDDGADWFRLGNFTQGQQVFVEILFNQVDGDLDLEMFVGSTWEAGSYSSSSNESISRNVSKAGNVTVRVIPKTGTTPRETGISYTIRR